MKAGYPDIANQLRPLPHNLGGNFRLGRYGQVGSAGGYYRQDSLGARNLFLLEHDCFS